MEETWKLRLYVDPRRDSAFVSFTNPGFEFAAQPADPRARPCPFCGAVRPSTSFDLLLTSIRDDVSPSRLSFNLHFLLPSMTVALPSSIDFLPPYVIRVDQG